MIDRAGKRLSSYYAGGVILVEASKRSMAPTRPGLAERVRDPLRVLEGVPQPGRCVGAQPQRISGTAELCGSRGRGDAGRRGPFTGLRRTAPPHTVRRQNR